MDPKMNSLSYKSRSFGFMIKKDFSLRIYDKKKLIVRSTNEKLIFLLENLFACKHQWHKS